MKLLQNTIETNTQKINDIEQQNKIRDEIQKHQQNNNKIIIDLQNDKKQKEKDSNIFMSELNKMKEQINKLMKFHTNNNEENKEISEEDKVRNWMKETVKLNIYCELLI
eukprot:41993_1